MYSCTLWPTYQVLDWQRSVSGGYASWNEAGIQATRSSGGIERTVSPRYPSTRRVLSPTGPVIRVAPNEVSLNDPEAFVAIYRQGTRFLKEPNFYGAFAGPITNLFTSIEPGRHSALKRLMAASFSRQSTVEHQKISYTTIASSMAQLTSAAEAGREIELSTLFRRFTLKSITEFCFGEGFEDETEEEQGETEDEVYTKLLDTFDQAPRALVMVSGLSFDSLLHLDH